MFLLDVNVLIALGDPLHVHHLQVTEWFDLLGLALHHGARLATLDRRIDPSLIPGGPNAFVLLVES